jgi:hypothetical protein
VGERLFAEEGLKVEALDLLEAELADRTGPLPAPHTQPARNPSRITAHVPSPDQRRCRE